MDDHVFEQHPVPQNISSYQFRLVGDMTIKQFFQLAAGAIIALLFYSSPLPGFLKWPFIIIFVLGGAAFAFLPIQERPLEQWVAAFIRSVYAPTLYKWSKTGVAPQYFQPESVIQRAQPGGSTPQPAKPSPVDAMTKSLTTGGAGFLSGLEEAEKKMLGRFTDLLNQAATQAKTIRETQLPKQNSTQGIATLDIPPIVDASQVLKTPIATPKSELRVPAQPKVETQKTGFQQPTPAEIQAQSQQGQTTAVNEPLIQEKIDEIIKSPSFSPDAAPPIPPTTPNVIVGQVIDFNHKIIESAILEIKDPLNRPVRALRSNKAGHFQIVTPLNNGTYKITTEKENYEFSPIEINVKGDIIPPIVIQAHEQKSNS